MGKALSRRPVRLLVEPAPHLDAAARRIVDVPRHQIVRRQRVARRLEDGRGRVEADQRRLQLAGQRGRGEISLGQDDAIGHRHLLD
jgi:hypothetical protein